MKLQKLPRYPIFSSTTKKDIIHSRDFHKNTQLQCQEIVKENQCNTSVVSKLLDRRWALVTPEAKIQKITLSKMKEQHRGQTEEIVFSNNAFPSLGLDMIMEETQNPAFYVVRDDLLHPLINGNKARKLDALIPLLQDYSVTDVVTCGGCQSAHAAAVAVSCAERGLRSHLLLRGEQPDIPTGYNLISTIYGNTIYVPRSFYSKREEMLVQHANLVAGSNGSVISFADIFTTYSGEIPTLNTQNHEKKVIVIKEGAGDSAALLGLIRLVEYLSQTHLFGRKQPIKIVVDSGTGTTAIGLALGAICLGLKWEVIAVMLADTEEGYKKQEQRLISDFKKLCSLECVHQALSRVDEGIVNWVERIHPRKFGNILKGEVGSCQKIAQQTGVLLDPIYTLAGWELATELCQSKGEEDAKIIMLHTGGTLGMFGLAQRYKSYFQTLKDPLSISKPLFS